MLVQFPIIVPDMVTAVSIRANNAIAEACVGIMQLLYAHSPVLCCIALGHCTGWSSCKQNSGGRNAAATPENMSISMRMPSEMA